MFKDLRLWKAQLQIFKHSTPIKLISKMKARQSLVELEKDIWLLSTMNKTKSIT